MPNSTASSTLVSRNAAASAIDPSYMAHSTRP